MIELKELTKKYNKSQGVDVLRNINLNVERGEFLSIMGPSGSGKSTLLRILGGIDLPTSGDYYYDGELINTYSQKMLSHFRNSKTSFIFQEYNLVRDISVFENIELPLVVRNKKRAERHKIVNDTIRHLHIENLSKRYPDSLSGGEKQKCAIARAIVSKNELLLADEPTGALDQESGKEILGLLCELNKKNGITIIMVTHDFLVDSYANRHISIHDGIIETDKLLSNNG